VAGYADTLVDSEIKAFTSKLAKLGYVWQFLPLAGQSGTAVGVNTPIRAIKEDGVLGYLNSESCISH
jgi:isocitrate lyase